MKFEILKFKSVTSTNDVAINLIKEKNKLTGCICSNLQTKGRGTYGKRWISEKGNLFLTLFFPIDEKCPSFQEFSIINPVIIFNIIKNYCDEGKLRLKFPNDIMYDEKKICGLLQEYIIQNDRKFLIIGIGLNIVSNPNINNDHKATNIYLETNIKPSIDEIIDLIISSYKNFLVNLDTYNYERFKKKAELLSVKK
jgi:BirA family biotin operon repressor/biotin-[acetyl-CoA-carboxylase] ligase